MRTSHVVLAVVSVGFVGVLGWNLRPHANAVSERVQRVPGQAAIPVAAAEMPVGLQDTVRQLSDLLEAGNAEEALRQCWAPSNLDQMSRTGLFGKCSELVKQDEKLRPTLKRILTLGPTKTYKTQEGIYLAEFDANDTQLTSMRFMYVNNHWYVC